MDKEILNVDLTPALRVWAKKKHVRVIDFSRNTGLTYSYSYGIMAGDGKFKHRTYGRFILIYGLPAFEEILRIAKIEPKGIVDLEPA